MACCTFCNVLLLWLIFQLRVCKFTQSFRGKDLGRWRHMGLKKFFLQQMRPVVYVAAHNAQFCHQRRWRSPFTSGRFTTGGAQCRSQVKFHLLQFVNNFIFMIYSICVQIWSSIVSCEETDLFEFYTGCWFVHTPHPISDCTVYKGPQARVGTFKTSVFCFQDKMFCKDPIFYYSCCPSTLNFQYRR